MARKRKAAAVDGGTPFCKKICTDVGVQPATIVALTNLAPYPEGFPTEAPKGDNLNALIQLEFKGGVNLVNKAKEEVDWEKLESADVLGLDTETQPRFVKGSLPNPTALLQLATEEECWVFQLSEEFGVSNETRQRLQSLLESPKVIKAGVGIRDDIRDLAQFWLPSMRSVPSVIELQDIVRPYGSGHTSLRSLAARFLNRRIAKSQQLSNWGSAQLTARQIWYAAVDAWAGYRLHQTLRSVFEESERWAPLVDLCISDS